MKTEVSDEDTIPKLLLLNLFTDVTRKFKEINIYHNHGYRHCIKSINQVYSA